MHLNRRRFIKNTALLAAGAGLAATRSLSAMDRPKQAFLQPGIIDTHVHAVGSAAYTDDLGDKVKTLADKISVNSRYPDLLKNALSAAPLDLSDILIQHMDSNGVSHAVIQTDWLGSNELVADTVNKRPDRFSGLLSLLRWAELPKEPQTEEKDLANSRAKAAEEVIRGVEELGLKGVGEFFVRSFTMASHPEQIAKDMQPVMNAVARYKIPIQISTGWSMFPHSLSYGDPVWVDEIAYAYPEVPIVLTKMGRSIQHLFDNALMVASRNVNVYFDIVDSSSAHIRQAADRIGAERLMFGTDWGGVTRWVREPHNVVEKHKRLLDGANLSSNERAQIEWKTAANIFRLTENVALQRS